MLLGVDRARRASADQHTVGAVFSPSAPWVWMHVTREVSSELVTCALALLSSENIL